MFNRYDAGERAVLVHIWFFQDKELENLQEFKNLVTSAGIEVLQVVIGKRNIPHSKYFVGKGKALEIAEIIKVSKASVILFNHTLTPVQERNLKQLYKCNVLDRIGLILNIFAQRARSYESKLQVELAQLRYLSTRLVHGWTHLERQKGGIGLRGPGETQLETDRRLLANRIRLILSRLNRVEKQRTQSRRVRNKADKLTISLVGYTNAGKSTLFNIMTSANAYTADKLFATLDPTLRRLNNVNLREVILADTVGFIRHLPHDLIVAFKTTLQETRQAKLLLHVIDATDIYINEKIKVVNDILMEIKANNIPVLLIMNKIDALDSFKPRIDYDKNNQPIRVWLSAKSGLGLSLLWEALSKYLLGEIVQYNLCLPPMASRLRSQFYQLKVIEKEWNEDDGSVILHIRIPINHWRYLCIQEPSLTNYII
ncbi:ribosome rescue GTPase HflX [Pantoea sp. Aalb]|uniref:ribosome rescue GTPase HflX n=1 Tax=Pantoea sp. Aalb TaxID=2576762 RepID=UPI00132B654E|nr:ribosome rescue GTPase HflX [Pantoea sp. Aalb]MXP67678.1 GTPase HflX [Pantoea sp. Aalb]